MSFYLGDVLIAGGSTGAIDDLSITKNADNEMQAIGLINQLGLNSVIKTWVGTKAQYDALGTYSNDTLYNITDDYTSGETSYNGLTNMPSINGVTLTGNKTSSDLSLLSTDASNLTSAGQKVFDGQWVGPGIYLAERVNTVEQIDYDLSTYLPNDNYNYEVLVYGMINIGTEAAAGSYRNLTIKTSLLSNDISLCAVRKTYATSSYIYTVAGSFAIPVGTDRLLTLSARPNDKGTIYLMLRGYRRIGTNS